MTFKLPEPVDYSDVPEFAHVWGYTADQVRQAYEQGLEDAAKVCGYSHIAAKILDLKEQTNAN